MSRRSARSAAGRACKNIGGERGNHFFFLFFFFSRIRGREKLAAHTTPKVSSTSSSFHSFAKARTSSFPCSSLSLLCLPACIPHLYGLLQRQQAPARGRRRREFGAEQDAAFVVRDRCQRRRRALLGGLGGAKVRVGGRGEGRAGKKQQQRPRLGRGRESEGEPRAFLFFRVKRTSVSERQRRPSLSAASFLFLRLWKPPSAHCLNSFSVAEDVEASFSASGAVDENDRGQERGE